MPNQAYKTTLAHLADLPDYIGKELGISSWITITQEDINTFAKLTFDEQWIHVDPERAARESPFKSTIAHGFMILSYASRFGFETIDIQDMTMGLNYGLDKLRFISPTPVNSRVRGRVTLLDVEEKAPGLKYKIGITFEMEGSDKPVCVAEWLAVGYA
jgi:acyl dehydratase